MRHIISSSIAAIAISFAVAGSVAASPITDGGNAPATKILMGNSQGNLVIGNEGAANDGQQSPLGQIVTRNFVKQAAATSEMQDQSAE